MYYNPFFHQIIISQEKSIKMDCNLAILHEREGGLLSPIKVPLIPSSPKIFKKPCFDQILRAAGKKRAKKCIFKHFLKNFDQKIAFFPARTPLKISIC